MNFIGAAILAAGASTRMGGPKMLLPWGDTSIIGHLVRVWSELVPQTAAVVALGDAGLVKELARAGVPSSNQIINPAPENEMFSSIQCAAKWPDWLERLTHVAIVLGDQPQISRETLRAMCAFAHEHPGTICQPRFNGRPKHPVFIPRPLLPQIAISQEPSLREFLNHCSTPKAFLDVDDASLTIDLDTPADFIRFSHGKSAE
jgi:molybdenum cofactor cytidylyltransferase